MQAFELQAPFEPTGDQPQAIEALTAASLAGEEAQVLLGVTGSGKTFTIACTIARLNRPVLLLAPNKTLAAQLHAELMTFFPKNAVEYFVSYYDYYQPEAYIPSTDTYIEKDALINEEIDRLRHAATYALLERRDVIIVASVSCIYGLGAPISYLEMRLTLETGQRIERRDLLRKLVDIHYKRSDYDLTRGHFRVRGDVIEVQPAMTDDRGIRVTLWGDEIESIAWIDPLRGLVLDTVQNVNIYPNSHFVTPEGGLAQAAGTISEELRDRLQELRKDDHLVEAQRLEQRTMLDLENMRSFGTTKGIENYSRHLTGRRPGDPPPTLLEYFPEDFLTIIDESHVSIPQVRAMFRGDRARKQNLVSHGFRLPSALDNRPLTFEEFLEHTGQTIYVSATPGDYELERTEGAIVEQLIRPTGLVEPEIEVRPVGTQVDDLLGEIRSRAKRNERVLVTTLTKRMSENLTEYYADLSVRVRYMHSDIDTLERVELLRGLRAGDFDVLIGINLLREGLDLPEVSLVAILDADKEGFLRSRRSMIQTMGRAARNIDGRVIMYADRITKSMRAAIDETDRRRELQRQYNHDHKIVPRQISKAISGVEALLPGGGASKEPKRTDAGRRDLSQDQVSVASLEKQLKKLRKEMKTASRSLEFEKAATLRDEIKHLAQLLLAIQ